MTVETTQILLDRIPEIVPDTSTMKTILTRTAIGSSEYTATEDGFIKARAQVGAGGRINLLTPEGAVSWYGAQTILLTWPWIRLRKGQKVTFEVAFVAATSASVDFCKSKVVYHKLTGGGQLI